MRPRALLFVCLALGLLGLAAASFRLRLSPVPVGDEATHVLMARSLWEEGDLVYDLGDLRGAYRIWNDGPAGVTLLTPDGGRSLLYAEPFAYALVSAPAWALLGEAGLPVLNMVLFLAMAASAAWLFRESTGGVGLFLGGFFFASAAFGYVFRGSPEVFLMACVFFALLLWRRVRERTTWDTAEIWSLVSAGALLGAACLHQPALGLLGAAVAVDLFLSGRWKGAAVMVLGGLLVFGLLSGQQRRMTGVWKPADPREGVQRRSFENEFPLESPQDVWQAYGKDRGTSSDGLRLLPRNLGYLLAGRYTGLIPYFPFGVLALCLMARDRSRWLLLAAVVIIVLLGLLLDPHRWHGGQSALGNARFAVLYPVLLFLPGRFAARRSLVLPYAAAGLWTAVAMAGAVVPPPPHAGEIPAFRALPVELTLLGDGIQLPGYSARSWGQGVWIVPRAAFWADEGHPNGVWVRGASTSDIVVVSPRPLKEVRFFVHSLTADNEMVAESGSDRVLVRFDSEGKRNGAPVDLAVEPAASGLGLLPGTSGEWVYRFTLSVSDGIIPARHIPESRDPRYLGVFLDFNGRGL
ncbi:MAG TPA: hypothetical protein VN493_12105 [Thermoanaerobaculia bacterium]|nr:hypothetical protein [Thermoanaerobaculia bacterium]